LIWAAAAIAAAAFMLSLSVPKKKLCLGVRRHFILLFQRRQASVIKGFLVLFFKKELLSLRFPFFSDESVSSWH
jgi:hypothetical protein